MEPTDVPPSVAIIGAGFSGTLLAVHLLRAAHAPLHLLLVERSGRFGRGLAYATATDSHLLNVRVANMSALPAQPGHFGDWLRAQHTDATPAEAPAFVPRSVYGRYLEDLLAAARAGARTDVRCTLLADEAVELLPTATGWRLRLAAGSEHRVARAVLCLGNFPPAAPVALPAGLRLPHYLGDPWDTAALAAIPPDAAVLIVGTGLTMVDVLLSLLDQGHRGPIVALSRRGLPPQRHATVAAPWPVVADGETFVRLRPLLERVRAAVHAAGGDWRAVVDALRPHTQGLWRGLPAAERRRFLRHLRPYWEIHRHRLAPPVADRLHAALGDGRLRLLAARLQAVTVRDDGRLRVDARTRAGGAPLTLHADALINCTGPQCDFARIRQPLLRSLIDRGLVHPDALGLGLDADGDGALLGADGRPQPGLYALGPLVRGQVWELTAVPELRLAAAALGTRLAAELAPA